MVLILSALTVFSTGASAEETVTEPSVAAMLDVARTARSAEEERLLVLAADKLLEGINGNSRLTDVEKALLVHDRLAAWTDYDYYTYKKTDKYDEDSYNKYGALLKHKAVCGGYTDAYSYLMNKIGIETSYINSPKMDHGWNVVVINNKPYYVDVTWDACHKGIISHKNFLLSCDGMIKTGHTAGDYPTTYKGVPINDTKYEKYYWQNSYSEFLLGEYGLENKIYYFDHVTGELKIANKNHSVIYSVPSDELVQYDDNFSHLCRTNDKMLFSYADKVYQIDCQDDSVISNRITAGLDELNIEKLEGIVEDEYGKKVDDIQWEMTGSFLSLNGSGKLGDHFRLKGNGFLDHYCCLPPVIKNLIKQIVISEGVQNISDCAFYGCSDLKSITIPKSVTSIGNYAFYCCSNLTSLTIPENASVKSIGNSAFYGCSDLKSITIPKSVTSIGNYAFYCCSNLTSLTIPENASVKSIGNCAFYGCDLTRVILPDSIGSIGNSAFYWYCTLYAENNAEAERFAKSNGNLFIQLNKPHPGKSGNWNWTVDKNFTLTIQGKGKIDDFVELQEDGYNHIIDAPWGKDIESIVIQNEITVIGNYVFCESNNLKSVTIPNSVTSIGEYAFGECTALTSVTIPDSVTDIGVSAFIGCTGLKSVTIPDSVSSIGRFAFANTDLTNITIPASVASIGNYAFGYYFDESGMSINKVEGFTIFGYKETAAEKYAKDFNLNFSSLDEDKLLLGDTDGDNVVSILDATAIQKKRASIAVSSFNEKAADVDGDGVVSVLDATYIQKSLAHIPIPYKVGEPID